MKSSAFCTTQSNAAARLLICGWFFLGLLSTERSLAAQAQGMTSGPAAPGVDLSPKALVDASNLTKAGNLPFHLKMTFRLSKLDGEPSDAGTLEYWWAGSQRMHLDVVLGGGEVRHSLAWADAPSTTEGRSLFLIDELLSAILSPARSLDAPGLDVISEQRGASPLVLQCMHAAPKPGSGFQMQTNVCVDVATGTVRLVATPVSEELHNRVARFRETRTALDVTLSLAGKQAISGRVEQLQSFDPQQTTVTLSKPEVATDLKPEDVSKMRVRGDVVTGAKISGDPPVYPLIARQAKIQGSVVLAAVITEQGSIAHLLPIASANAMLTPAAMDAVSRWKYKPYLLNGSPTSVATTITVNFSLGVPSSAR